MKSSANVAQEQDLAAIAADLVYRLVGMLTIEDLEDPAAAQALATALDIIEGKPEQLPEDLVDQLAMFKDKAEAFRAAVRTIGKVSPETLKKLAASMQAAGLLRAAG